jgi:rhamnose utilization protein RhaD (predicted bifunctional aldolase and dehydrogenase)
VTGGEVDLVWVKGSGGDLGTLRPGGLAVLRLDRLRSLAWVYPGVDREDEMVAALDFCLHGRGGAALADVQQRCDEVIGDFPV